MQVFYNKWSRTVLLNLLIVAIAGTLLRYKIIWSIPGLDYKYLLHAHSHFAFTGWVSLCLSVCIVSVLNVDTRRLKLYNICFCIVLLAAIGMLLSFPFGGYYSVSIFFSTLSIFASWFLAWLAWKDLSLTDLPVTVTRWFKAGLIFYVLSAAGPFYLARLMALQDGHQHWYIGSIYFFLHFQYNGWFTFAVTGLFMALLYRRGVQLPVRLSALMFWLQSIACVPAFFLSTLWMKLPDWLYRACIAAAVMQAIALLLLLWCVLKVKTKIFQSFDAIPVLLWGMALLACSLKTIMQCLSVFPRLSYLAFGYRPVVIGYLHLILLGFITLFLLGFLIQQEYIRIHSFQPLTGIFCFVSGVILNEFFLFVQALASIAGRNFSLAGYCLFGAALLMLCGITLLYLAQLNNNLFKYGSVSNKQRGPAASTS